MTELLGWYGSNGQQRTENLIQRHILLHEARQVKSVAIWFEITRNGEIDEESEKGIVT